MTAANAQASSLLCFATSVLAGPTKRNEWKWRGFEIIMNEENCRDTASLYNISIPYNVRFAKLHYVFRHDGLCGLAALILRELPATRIVGDVFCCFCLRLKKGMVECVCQFGLFCDRRFIEILNRDLLICYVNGWILFFGVNIIDDYCMKNFTWVLMKCVEASSFIFWCEIYFFLYLLILGLWCALLWIRGRFGSRSASKGATDATV